MTVTNQIIKQEKRVKTGQFEGYASVFNRVDRGNDLILPGAFEHSLRDRGAGSIKLLWQHDPKRPVGVIDEIFEDKHGLYMRASLMLDLEKADEAYRMLTAGVLDSMSIGFHTLKSHKRHDGVRLLEKVDLWEISLVTFPMNEAAKILSIKADTAPAQENNSQEFLAVNDPALIAGLRHLTTLMEFGKDHNDT